MFWLVVALAILATGFLLLELIARFGLGLGNPPLWQADDECEYIYQPSQTYRRFGNRVSYNAYSMRSDEFPPEKTDPQELRILCLGDSIINGGSRTDQADLATTLVQHRLREKLNRAVVVGNVSCGSWGPQNLLAYVRRHGLFDADIVVVVFNSFDYIKKLRFHGLGISKPSRKPLCALTELYGNYIVRWLRRRRRPPVPPTFDAESSDEAVKATRELFDLLQAAGVLVILLQYLGREEIVYKPEAGFAGFQAIAYEHEINVISLGPAFKEALGAGRNPFMDKLHPNELGQQLIADAMFTEIAQLDQANPQ